PPVVFVVLAIWLYCTGKWGRQGRESVKQTNKAQTSYGCFAPRMIWLFLSLGFMRLIMSQIKVSDRRGLSTSFSFSFIRTEPNPGWLCVFTKRFLLFLSVLLCTRFGALEAASRSPDAGFLGVVHTVVWFMFNA
ncbi:MAG TPA: hypothetical protein PLV20_01240, partial [Anaerolineaceae bacterium]|nr:hypothetical protein [Anaerolineaceae bacterium]